MDEKRLSKSPKLRTVEKHKPPYPLNRFPGSFALELGKEIVCHLASRDSPRLEGSDWEEIFARLIGATWKPSNVGLDDVVLGQTAWGAKTVKSSKPSTVSRIRLISGRNSPVYSFGDTDVRERDADELGEKVLSIWNERVAGVRQKYQHLRTVVLVKSQDLLEVAAFEFDTIYYQPERYKWTWNQRNNLEGRDRETDSHLFTWQPHGSQFTIIETVPPSRLAIRVRKPKSLVRSEVLKAVSFDDSWVEVI